MIDNAGMLGQALGRPPLESAGQDLPDPSGHDLENGVAAALWPCVESVQALPPEQEIDLGGPTITAEQLTKYLSVEFLVHASDVARATSSEVDASPELAEAVFRHAVETQWTLFVTEEIFASPVTSPANARPLERLWRLLAVQRTRPT